MALPRAPAGGFSVVAVFVGLAGALNSVADAASVTANALHTVTSEAVAAGELDVLVGI
jgi:hypothetical protein